MVYIGETLKNNVTNQFFYLCLSAELLSWRRRPSSVNSLGLGNHCMDADQNHISGQLFSSFFLNFKILLFSFSLTWVCVNQAIVGFQPLMALSLTASWIRWCMQVHVWWFNVDLSFLGRTIYARHFLGADSIPPQVCRKNHSNHLYWPRAAQSDA